MSELLNWKRTTKNLEQYEKIALWAWMSSKNFKDLVNEARNEEYKHSTWKDISFVPNLDLNTLKDLDLDSMDLLEVLMQKETWKQPTEHDLKVIRAFIKSIKE